MAEQQHLEQDLDQGVGSNVTQNRIKDNTHSRTTDSIHQDKARIFLKGTDNFRIIDPQRYTAAVSKVLSHNLKMARQETAFAAFSTTPIISTEIEINPLFTVMQRPIELTTEWETRPVLNITGGSVPLRIIPSAHLPLPEWTVGAPMLAYWRFSSTTTTEATLTRFGKTSMNQTIKQAIGIRDMASLTYMEPVTSHSIPTITFQPHESEIHSRDASNIQATESLMLHMYDNWGSTKYMVDLPSNLEGLTVMWVFSHIEGFADGRLIADPQREKDLALAETLKLYADKAATLRDTSSTSPSTPPPMKSHWSIYPVQQLVDIHTGRILATYARNAPPSKTAGTLTIYPKLVADLEHPYECLSAELIEGIVIVTAAMVEMQTRKGVLAGLREAGAESIRWLEEPPHPLRSDP